jgi:glycosyltransferase involved in cell wall biosynthesis
MNVEKYPDHPKVVVKISPQVSVFSGSNLNAEDLVSRFGLELVHSAIWWADCAVLSSADRLHTLPWVITMHGCHENLIDHPYVDPEFSRKMGAMIQRADAWVHTADKNERVFSQYGQPELAVRILNGVAIENRTEMTRNQVGLSKTALVACVASRAIEEKGWNEAVAAVTMLRAAGREVELLLIGDGPAAEVVRRQTCNGIFLIKHVPNPQDYMRLADLLLLPSFFAGESLPHFLLEGMALGKPFVATAVGDIPKLAGTEEDAAGVLISMVAGRPDINALAAGIERLADPKVRHGMGKNGFARYRKNYTLNIMADRYNTLYNQCIANRKLNSVKAI